jgi:DNA-binding MarR family transcriptional regulator
MKRHPISGIENGEEVIYFPYRFIDSIHNGLRKSAWWLYMTIANECIENKSYSTNLTNKELAEKSRFSESSIIRALKDLEKDHFIERNYSGHIREIKLSDY